MKIKKLEVKQKALHHHEVSLTHEEHKYNLHNDTKEKKNKKHGTSDISNESLKAEKTLPA